MMHITLYNADGRIVRQKTIDDMREVKDIVPEGGWFDLGEPDPDLWHYPGGVLTARPELAVADAYEIVADGEDEILLALPAETLVTTDGKGVTTDDDDGLIYSTTVAGAHEVLLVPPWPWRRKTVVIHAKEV